MYDTMPSAAPAVAGTERWTTKDGGVKLFLFEKAAGDPAKTRGTILSVHGSSMASQPTFDLQVPGRPHSSAMEYFAGLGFDCWAVDMEGYRRSTKDRDNNAPISQGSDVFDRDHPDKPFAVRAGISHASFQQKNCMTVYHILASWFSRPEPVYRG